MEKLVSKPENNVETKDKELGEAVAKPLIPISHKDFNEFIKGKGFVGRQVVYAMDPRFPFSKLVLRKIKIMTDGRSVDVISGNFS